MSLEQNHERPSDADKDAFFSSDALDKVLQEVRSAAEVSLPKKPLPTPGEVREHRAAQKRIPKVRGSKKPKKVRIQTRRSKPKGRQ